jgi:hypothetical protein
MIPLPVALVLVALVVALVISLGMLVAAALRRRKIPPGAYYLTVDEIRETDEKLRMLGGFDREERATRPDMRKARESTKPGRGKELP